MASGARDASVGSDVVKVNVVVLGSESTLDLFPVSSGDDIAGERMTTRLWEKHNCAPGRSNSSAHDLPHQSGAGVTFPSMTKSLACVRFYPSLSGDCVGRGGRGSADPRARIARSRRVLGRASGRIGR